MKKILFILVLPLIIFSCATLNNSTMQTDTNIKRIDRNMTKEEVISIMGNYYQRLGLSKESEKIGYVNSHNTMYVLTFVEGRLVEWNSILLNNLNSNTSSIGSSVSAIGNNDNSSMKTHLEAHRNAMLSGATSDSQKQAINDHMNAHEKGVLGE